MDSFLLYTDMIVSFLLHIVGTFAIASIFSMFLKGYELSMRVWILILGSMVFSFIVNFCALLVLQTTSCNGLKDPGGVAVGAGIGSIITGFFMWIPTIWEGLRLSISQVFVDHLSLMTPGEAAREGVIMDAAQQLLAVPTQRGGKHITPEEYDNQTFYEITSAMAYMAAFAGAYGIGIGSRYAVNCK